MSDRRGRPGWAAWLKIVGLTVVVLALFAFVASVPVLFVPLLVAIVLNASFAPLVSALERRDWQHTPAVLLVFGGLILALAIGVIIIPTIATREVNNLQVMWPQGKVRITELLQRTQDLVNSRVPESNRVNLVADVPVRAQKLAQDIIAEAPQSMPDLALMVLLIPLFTFFLMRDGRDLKRALVAAVPNRYFEMTLSILYSVNQQVGNYLRGLLMEGVTDSVIATVLCAVLGVPNALMIGIVTGSTAIVPLAGIAIGAVVGPLIAVLSSTGDPLTIVGLTVAAIVSTHILDNIVVAPLIMGHSVHIHPIAVVVSIMLAGKFFGVLGIILAVPVVSILTTVIQEGYRGFKSNEYYLEHT
jgi:putative permease